MLYCINRMLQTLIVVWERGETMSRNQRVGKQRENNDCTPYQAMAAVQERSSCPDFRSAAADPYSLSAQDVLGLQKTIGNQAVMQLFGNTGKVATSSPKVAQMKWMQDVSTPIWQYKHPKTIIYTANKDQALGADEQNADDQIKALFIRDEPGKNVIFSMKKTAKQQWDSIDLQEDDTKKYKAKLESEFHVLTSIGNQFRDAQGTTSDQEYQALTEAGSKKILVARNKTKKSQSKAVVPSIHGGKGKDIKLINGGVSSGTDKNSHAEIILLANLTEEMVGQQKMPLPKPTYKVAGTKWPCAKCLAILKGYQAASANYLDLKYDAADNSKRKPTPDGGPNDYHNPMIDIKTKVASYSPITQQDKQETVDYKQWCQALINNDAVWKEG